MYHSVYNVDCSIRVFSSFAMIFDLQVPVK